MEQQLAATTQEAEEDVRLLPRLRRIHEFYAEYNRITHDVLGAASKEESDGLMQWVNSAKATEEQIADLEKHKSSYQLMLRSAEKLQKDFMNKLDGARNKKIPLLSKDSYNDWQARFRRAYYKEKESFVDTKLPEFIRNWETLIQKRADLLRNPGLKKLTTGEVPDLKEFLDDKKFGEMSNKKRIGVVASVQAALLAKEKNVPLLFAQAKAMLEAAAQAKALSWNKVGVWLERIFKTGADPQLIAQFINGSGGTIAGKKTTLSRLIANWSEASTHFRVIENKRGKLGTPPGFHFVSMEVFLNWRYEQRTSYLQHAEDGFNDINKEPEVFLKIRHEMGAQDWDSAEELIAQAKREEWGTENAKKLDTMGKFLREHRSQGPQAKEEESPTAEEMIAEMQGYISLLSPKLQRSYIKALNRGYQTFWALTTLMYNRVWCHQHNFLDDSKEKKMEAEAKEKTRERVEKGHQKMGLEVNVIKDDTNTEAAIRDQSGVKGAQILCTNEQSAETLVDQVDQQKNKREFWYWTTVVPEGVIYAEHLHIVQSLHPKMKKLARMMEERGLRYPLTGGHSAVSTETQTASKV